MVKFGTARGPTGTMKTLIRILLLAAIYFGCAFVIPVFSLSDGYAAGIWPGTGVAFAFCLLWGPKNLIGLFLGAFLFNLYRSSHIGFLHADSITLSFLISVGATLEVGIGQLLLRQFRLYPNPLDSPQNLLKFLAVCGPLACSISPSIGVFTLIGFDIIPKSELLFGWFNWWVGDCIGAVLFTPLLLTSYSAFKNKKFKRLAIISIPSLLVFLGVAGLFLYAKTWEEKKIKYQVESDVDLQQEGYIHEYEGIKNVLGSIERLYISSNSVELSEFQDFTMHYLREFPFISALEWVPVVKPENKEKFIKEAREKYYPDFELKFLNKNEAALKNQKDYYPVYYAVPLSGNEKALGLDLGSNAERLEVINRAISTAEMAGSKVVSLVQDSQKENGLLLFNPIFKSQGNEKLGYRTIDLIGFALAVIKIEDWISLAGNHTKMAHFYLEISDVTDKNAVHTIYLHHNKQEKLHKQNVEIRHINFSGRTMEFKYIPYSSYISSFYDWKNWLVQLAGLIFICVIVIFMLLVSGDTQRIENLIRDKTQSLIMANAELSELILERKEIEYELRLEQEKTEKANLAKSMFLANMSHEIRTPMNGIMGLGDMLSRTSLTEEQAEFVRLINISSESLLTIINDILDFSKIEAGKLQLENVSFHMEKLLIEVSKLMELKATEKGIDLKLHLDSEMPAFMVGDAQRVRQILINLVSNAIKFTNEGSVEVIAKVKSRTDSKAKIFLSVKDTGIGIAPEKQHQIFSEFEQADVGIQRKFGGTGLGLSISKRLIEMMGGHLMLQSIEGKGSEFSFYLNLPIHNMGPVKIESSNNIEFDIKNLKCFLIGHPQGVCPIYFAALEKKGIHPEVIEKFELEDRVKETARNSDVDKILVMADYDFRHKDLDEFSQNYLYLKDIKLDAKVKFLYVSGAAMRGEAAKISELGFDGYIPGIEIGEWIREALPKLFATVDKSKPARLVTKHSLAEARYEEEQKALPDVLMKKRILLVEDNEINQKVAQKMLEKLGCSIEIATDGLKALECIGQKDYDVVLMDCQMPNMDGYEAATRIREGQKQQNIPIIALTANAIKGTLEKCIASGMNSYISKPISLDSLKDALYEQLSKN